MRRNSLYKKLCLLFPVTLCIVIVVNGQDIPDGTIKKHITPITNSLQKLALLKPASFEYDQGQQFKHLSLQKGRQYGFIAEELESLFPELIQRRSVNYMFGKNAYRQARIKVIDETRLIPVLVASIQEQQSEIEKLKLEIEALKKTTAALPQAGATGF